MGQPYLSYRDVEREESACPLEEWVLLPDVALERQVEGKGLKDTVATRWAELHPNWLGDKEVSMTLNFTG